MTKPNCLWIARTNLHRLVRWIDGVETEFPISFGRLTEPEREQVVCVLKTLCEELDDYHDNLGLATRSVEIRITEMKEPAVR